MKLQDYLLQHGNVEVNEKALNDLLCIKESKVIAYDDLGTEAIRELKVENFPVIVVIDSEGNNLYENIKKNI